MKDLGPTQFGVECAAPLSTYRIAAFVLCVIGGGAYYVVAHLMRDDKI